MPLAGSLDQLARDAQARLNFIGEYSIPCVINSDQASKSPSGSYAGALVKGGPPISSLLANLTSGSPPFYLLPCPRHFTTPGTRGRARGVKRGKGTSKNHLGDVFPPLPKQIMYLLLCQRAGGSPFPPSATCAPQGKKGTFQHEQSHAHS